MAVTLNATAVPAPVVPGTPNYMKDQNSTTGTPSTSLALTSGNLGAQVSSKFNRNNTGHDQQTVYGAGGYGKGTGLTLSAGTGLSVAVSDGQALINGLVELRNTSSTTAVVGATSTAWVWLMQDGTLTVQNGTTAKPSGNCCLLGAALTDATAVTAIETGGVVSFQGGQLYRETNDAAAPGDSPDASLRLFTKTQGGTYFWDGVSHKLVAGTTTRLGTDANKTGVVSGDLYFPNDGVQMYRHNGSTLDPYGPLFPLTAPPSHTDWSTYGAAFTTKADSKGGIYLEKSGVAGDNYAIMARTHSAPYTATACFLLNQVDVGSNWTASVLFYETASGKFKAIARERSTLVVNTWTNSTTLLSTQVFTAHGTHGPCVWFQVEDNNTNLIFRMSADGVNWITVHTATRATGFTTAPDRVGVGLNAPGTATPDRIGTTLLSWKVE